jgi:hypothetical protein
MFRLIFLTGIFLLQAITGFSERWDPEEKPLRKALEKAGETGSWKELPPAADVEQQGRFFRTGDQGHPLYLYAGRVQTCRQGGCSSPSPFTPGLNSEFFDYFILFNADFSVRLVRIYNYEATHGQEIMNKGWLKQFEDYDGSGPLTVGKTIDAISGATISVYAITSDIREKTGILKDLLADK